MPFALLPSSPGFQAPQAPSWEPFALQANQMIANQPHVNTAEIVDRAAQQINQILALSSPEAKLQRSLHLQQIQTMQEVYRDFREHPENYTMTAHGPVRTDPYERMAKLASIQHTAASTAYLNKRMNQGTPAFITSAIQKMTAAQNAEKQGATLPSSKTPVSVPVDNIPSQVDSSDNSDATADVEAASGAPDNPFNY